MFGPPMEQHYSQHNMPDFPLIGLIWHRNGQQPAERWHTDHTNRERPPAATMLYGVETASALRGMVPGAKIIGLSMFAGEFRRSLLAASGFDMILTKHQGLAKLAEAINALLPRTTT